MSSLWPWLMVAGFGALHGLNPATGWALAAARGVRTGRRAAAFGALVPIAAGHAASAALLASAVVLMPLEVMSAGSSIRASVAPGLMEGVAAVAFSAVAWCHRHGGPAHRRAPGAGGLAMGSFWMATVHGTGLMLVPAWSPYCSTSTSAFAGGVAPSTAMALAGAAVHLGAMLLVTVAMAAGVCGGIDARRRRGKGLPSVP